MTCLFLRDIFDMVLAPCRQQIIRQLDTEYCLSYWQSRNDTTAEYNIYDCRQYIDF